MFYFNWLQKDNPTGTVDTFPELKDKFETSVPGLFCVGDLTGIPLIKLAAESGFDLIEKFHGDTTFQKLRKDNDNEAMLDFVIVGAGPSGVAAGIRAQELGYRFLIIESSQKLNTIVNFPKGKPIYVTPVDTPFNSALKFSDGTKETLLDELNDTISPKQLPIHENEMVSQISKESTGFTITSKKGSYKALRVIVAIGKTGNARTLSVPGEKLSKVFTRLIDPGEYNEKDILVVGGGDSALEAANALAQTGNRVTLSYRRDSFSRPKEQNTSLFNQLVEKGSITPLFKSTVKEIKEDEVTLATEEGDKTIPNDAVYGLIGTEMPLQFFKRAGIRMEGEKRLPDYVKCATLLLFSSILYFGKSSPITTINSFFEFLSLPTRFFTMQWPELIKSSFSWLSFWAIILCSFYLIGHVAKNSIRYFNSSWNSFKHSYYIVMLLLFSYLYIGFNLQGSKLLGFDTGVWYTLMYSVTIVIFGFRRIHVNPTGYIKRQTYLLMAIQVIPLCILPVFVLPWMGNTGLLGDWVMEHVFPGNSYYRSYGLILAWPLFIHNLAAGQPVMFWLILSVVQSFVIIPYINYRWGKGAYCGWICSCGALAETLGDEYRTKAPHGPIAKQWDNAGQIVLWFAAIVSLLIIINTWFKFYIPSTKTLQYSYSIIVDIILAGVLGVGVYFFLSGRVWCRFFCPLAALMHIYTKFSVYRIFSNKKRCISCNICTKVCHMGIDVMNYANKGIPMNDVECVRCSACVVHCPMQVLTFGSVDSIDLDNTLHKEKKTPLTPGWASGLPDGDIAMLLDLESKQKTNK